MRRDVRQGGPQGASAPRQQAFQRFDADLHQGGGFDIAQLLIVTEDDGFALPFRQTRQGRLDPRARLGRQQAPVRRRAVVDAVRQHIRRDLAPTSQPIVA